MKIEPVSQVYGRFTPPPDKSMTHRAFLFSAISNGKCTVHNPLYSRDTVSTMKLVTALGAKIEEENGKVLITPPFRPLEPITPINCGNSGTTARIGMGLLARFSFFTVLYGDASLSRRPMKRVIFPLEKLGTKFDGRNNASYLPISIRGGHLHSNHYDSPISSAQVKSAFIFAALSANSDSYYTEKTPSRDHSERFLSQFELVEKTEKYLIIHPGIIPPFEYNIPGDFSSAAFFLVLGAIHPHSNLKIENVGLNPTRTGLISVMKRMGAHLKIIEKNDCIEPYGTIVVESSNLVGTEVHPDEIPSMIDEIPLVALLGTFAEGETIVHGAAELRVKESDRIKTTVDVLSKMGANIEELEDGFCVHGKTLLHGAKISAFGDHRIAMMASIGGISNGEGVEIEDAQCVSVSYPTFFSDLKGVTK